MELPLSETMQRIEEKRDNQMQISKKKIFQLFSGIFVILLCIGLDQFTKYLAVFHLKGKPSIPILPGIFELFYLENHGAAFGILQGQKSFLIAVTAATMILLIYILIRIPENKHYFYIRLILLLLISGAIGNFIDRCLYDYVIDFFYFRLIDFPIFNVADIFVSTAAVLLVLLFCFYYKEEDIELLTEQILFWKRKSKH